MWESNPPDARFAYVATGFEDQASHQTRSGPVEYENHTHVTWESQPNLLTGGDLAKEV